MTDENKNTIAVHDCEPAIETMRDDVLRGLAQDPKMLPSQYLYDARGARLFERICETEEYYLTRTEMAIMRDNMRAIVDRIGPRAMIIEPGSGSGIKTELLLENLEDPAAYVAIEVSRQQLRRFAAQMDGRFPGLDVLPICADFSNGYELPESENLAEKRVAYFPGSTIGNFMPSAAVKILRRLGELCGDDGGLLIGFDLKKDRSVLEPAYDDAEGVSREFALNYLERLNRELHGDFDLDRFGYQAPYNEADGRIEMALVSLCRQVAHVDGVPVLFDTDERVLTEYSHKYSLDEFRSLAGNASFDVLDTWTDPDCLFSVQYLSKGRGLVDHPA